MTSIEHSSQSTHRLLPAAGAYGELRGRAIFQALKVVLAALLAYAIWRAYQSPDLLLDLSSWRLC